MNIIIHDVSKMLHIVHDDLLRVQVMNMIIHSLLSEIAIYYS